MTFLDKLNLRPMERRIVIIAVVLVFAVVNVVWVWPRFKDWKKIQDDFGKAKDTIQKYKAEIAKTKEYEQKKNTLEREDSVRLPEEAAVQLRRDIQNQASQSGLIVNVNDMPRGTTRPDQFFDEHSSRVTTTAADNELIDFLYNISKDKSMIRVRDLNIRPDPQQLKLICDMTLTASFQKKSTSKVAPPPARPAGSTGQTANATQPAQKPNPDSTRVQR